MQREDLTGCCISRLSKGRGTPIIANCSSFGRLYLPVFCRGFRRLPRHKFSDSKMLRKKYIRVSYNKCNRVLSLYFQVRESVYQVLTYNFSKFTKPGRYCQEDV